MSIENQKSKIIQDFEIAKSEFEKTLGETEIEIVVKIREIINLAGKNIQVWPMQQLSTIEERLARYTETLGETYAQHDTEGEWLSAYINENIARDWNSEKENLKQIQGKVTQADLERQLSSRYWQDTSRMILVKGQAKKYKAIISAVDRVILALTHKIRQLEKEYQYSNK